MASAEAAMRKLASATSRLAKIDEQREKAMRDRDEALRAAHALGATYKSIREVTSMSPSTISKALNREA
jgi:hypothetical protein